MHQRLSLSTSRRLALVLGLASGLAACGGSQEPTLPPEAVPNEGDGVLGQYVWAGGLRRTYTLFVPDNPGGQSLPLLIVLHGAGGSGQGMRSAIGLDALASRRRFVVAYPDGLGTWANGLGTSADYNGIDDVGFIHTLIAHLAANLPIDRRRVHVAGFSDGATMCYQLGCRLTTELASITAVSSGVTIFQELYGKPSEPVPVQLISGTLDPIFPWRDVVTTARQWAALNDCRTNKTDTLPDSPDDDIQVSRTLYSDCDAGADVRLFIVVGLGHTWPGATWDPTIVSFSASQQVMDFAVQHPRGS